MPRLSGHDRKIAMDWYTSLINLNLEEDGELHTYDSHYLITTRNQKSYQEIKLTTSNRYLQVHCASENVLLVDFHRFNRKRSHAHAKAAVDIIS